MAVWTIAAVIGFIAVFLAASLLGIWCCDCCSAKRAGRKEREARDAKIQQHLKWLSYQAERSTDQQVELMEMGLGSQEAQRESENERRAREPTDSDLVYFGLYGETRVPF